MVTIQRLYERLEELVTTADSAVDEFNASGDLTQLVTDLNKIGQTAFQLSNNVNDIGRAVSDGDLEVLPSPGF